MPRRTMNVGALRKLMEGLPDDAPVLTTGSDHSYRAVEAEATTALQDEQHGDWTEDYGEDVTSEKEFGKRRKVLIVR